MHERMGKKFEYPDVETFVLVIGAESPNPNFL